MLVYDFDLMAFKFDFGNLTTSDRLWNTNFERTF